jgi:hypothetical protein
MFDDPSELSKDAEQATAWLSNEMTWKDIWKKKSIDFLRIVAQGGEPVWNSEQKGFVAKVDDMGASSYNTPVPPAQSGYPTPVANTEADNSAEPVTLNVDDLPF